MEPIVADKASTLLQNGMLTPLERSLKRASLLVTIGLSITLVSLLMTHPLAFMGFLVFGVVAVGVGIAIYLLSLLRYDQTSQMKRSSSQATR